MTLREKAIQEAVRAITEQRREFQRRWLALWPLLVRADLPEPPTELVARTAFDAILSVIMEPDEAMIEAGAGAIVKSFMGDFTIFQSDVEEYKADALASHQAMIRKLMGDRG